MLCCADHSWTRSEKDIDLELHEFSDKAWGNDPAFPQHSDTQSGYFFPRYNPDLATLAGMPRCRDSNWSAPDILSGGLSSAAGPRRQSTEQGAGSIEQEE